MAGLDPAIHVFVAVKGNQDVDARHRRAEATPFFERLWPGMTEKNVELYADGGRFLTF